MPNPCPLTAFVVTSATEAFAAWTCQRRPSGPNGEPRLAVLLRTRDAGVSWAPVPLARAWWTRLRFGGFPTWPPEAVLELRVVEGVLTALHRDEWVPYEPGGESLWLSTRGPRGRWTHRRLRTMKYEGEDSAFPVPAVPPPSGFRMPSEAEVMRAMEA